MRTIAKHNEVITVIFSLAVEPSRQQERIDLMIDALLATTKHQPGFVSISKPDDATLKITKGDRIHFAEDALLKESKYEPVREYWKGLAENEFNLYEVVFTEPLMS